MKPVPMKRLNKQQENHSIINNCVDDILLNETKTLNAENNEAPEFWKIIMMRKTCIRWEM